MAIKVCYIIEKNGDIMILNEITREEIKTEVKNILKKKGSPVLYLENNGIPNYGWSSTRTQKILATCFNKER